MSNNYKISIILPNYNSDLFLNETIRSIKYQTHKNWELIIVDDNSNKKTKNILFNLKKDKRIKIFYLKKNKGAGYCRNIALKKAKAKYIAFIDSDDIWNKNKLTQQLNYMNKTGYDFTYTSYFTFRNFHKKRIINKINPINKFDLSNFINDTSIGTSTIMLKKDVIKNIKFTNTPILEDYFFKCQILRKVKFAYCFNKYLTFYRLRKDSLQSNRLKNIYWLWHINHKYNKLSFVKNIFSIISISINSIKKYGFK